MDRNETNKLLKEIVVNVRLQVAYKHLLNNTKGNSDRDEIIKGKIDVCQQIIKECENILPQNEEFRTALRGYKKLIELADEKKGVLKGKNVESSQINNACEKLEEKIRKVENSIVEYVNYVSEEEPKGTVLGRNLVEAKKAREIESQAKELEEIEANSLLNEIDLLLGMEQDTKKNQGISDETSKARLLSCDEKIKELKSLFPDNKELQEELTGYIKEIRENGRTKENTVKLKEMVTKIVSIACPYSNFKCEEPKKVEQKTSGLTQKNYIADVISDEQAPKKGGKKTWKCTELALRRKKHEKEEQARKDEKEVKKIISSVQQKREPLPGVAR